MSRLQVNKTRIELSLGDITVEATDAIVNAANTSLLGGGGVDGAIHRAAGPGLLAETSRMGGCATGDAKISGGHALAARHVIHAVGPVYDPGDLAVPGLLASAYRRSLELADEHRLRSIAFPAISAGVYGYPLDEAARIALETVVAHARGDTSLELVRFVLFNQPVFDAFEAALEALEGSPG